MRVHMATCVAVIILASFLGPRAGFADHGNDQGEVAKELRSLREEVRSLTEEVKNLKQAAILADARVMAELLSQADPEKGLRMWGAEIAGKSRSTGGGREFVSYLSVNYRGPDPALRYLPRLENVEEISLAHSHVTDDGLANLAAMTSLRELNLQGVRLSDEGLKHLANLRELRSLTLSGEKITGKGLNSLRSLENLETLSLNGTSVDDESLGHLSGLINLERLDLASLNSDETEHGGGRRRFTGNGLKHLGKLDRLQQLNLTNTPISDASVEHLVELKSLRVLRLGVQDFGPEGVENLKKLHLLEVLDGGVSSQQQREVADALPKLFIYNP